jgi:hypothetical protein
MTVRYSFSDARRWSVAWPVLVTDGATETELALAGNRLLARRNRDATEYEVSGCGDIALSDELYPHKRGYMRIARAHVLEGVTPMLTIRDRSGTEG